MGDGFLFMKNISKTFDSVQALMNVDLSVKLGTIHGVLGENGAGKSVLMKILAGSVKCDYGSIFINGSYTHISAPIDALKHGIVTIYQNVNLVENISVAENLFLGRLPRQKFLRRVQWNVVYARAEEIFNKLNFEIDPHRLVSDLNYTQKRMVEIAKALVNDVRILVLDEAHIGLTEYEEKNYLSVLKDINQQGITIIYISHNIDEVLSFCDAFTVLKNGQNVLEFQKGEMPKEDIIRAVVGGTIKRNYPRILTEKKRVLLSVQHLSSKRVLKDITFKLYKGEILGVAGLVGSGRTAVARALFGLESVTGEVYMNETLLRVKSPADAIKAGIGYLPEDMLRESLNANFDITENITLANLKDISRAMWIDQNKEKSISREFIKKLFIKTPSIQENVANLSQGNQQKVHFSKWIHANSKLLILDEPTNGIDIGTRVDIYNYMNNYVLKGNSILLISSNMDELIGMCDRIMVLNNGAIVSMLERNLFSKESIIRYASEGK